MPAVPSAAVIDTLDVESHARFLAHDLLEGRHPASRGERLAALYIVARLHALGIRPLPSAGYRMPVPLTAVTVGDDAVLRRADDAGAHALHPPDFFHPGGGRSAFRGFSGRLLFAGPTPGARTGLAGHADLSGHVVVLTPPWSELSEVEVELRRRGAEGAIHLIPDSLFYERLRIVRGPTRYFLPDTIDDPANQSRLPRVTGGPALIRALALEDEARPGAEVDRARRLGARVEVDLPHVTERRTGFNVAGYVRGSEPSLREEWVVIVAHYDHVGFGAPTDGDSIWNGFIDNAVGSAMLLEIASEMASRPPARSVAFLWVTAEEQGLLGSNWFVHDSPLPLARIHAMLNLDGGAPPAPPARWGLVGADASAPGRMARRIIEEREGPVTGVEVGPQSDHWPFHRAGVPAMLLFPTQELEGLTEAQAEALHRRWHRPHTPDDEWSPDFPFGGVERYANLALQVARALADSTSGR